MRFLADENFDNDILRGVRREVDDFDVMRVQDTMLAAADDPTILAWAAETGRICSRTISRRFRAMRTSASSLVWRCRVSLPFAGKRR